MSGGAQILVTGGTGFIGREIVRQLSSSGASVYLLTRNSGSESAQSLSGLPGVTLVEAGSHDQFSHVLPALPLTHVIHAAAPGVRPEDRTWSRLNEGCTIYTLALLEALKDKGLRRFLNVGSWSEYAPPLTDDQPLSEDHTLESRNLYGAAKASAFLSAQAYAEQQAIPFVSTRLFNIYGPGEAEARLIPYVITKMKAGEAVDLTPGLQERDFVFVRDAADALIRLALHETPLKQSVYNICSGVGTSVRDMALAAAAELKADPALLKFGARPYRADEPMRVTGVPTRISEELGWTASTPIADGVAELVRDVVRRMEG